MKKYVLGFLFSEDRKFVALIRKLKPEWQKGRLNGLGGKINLLDYSPMFAMIREFKEEAGVDITDWVEFAKLQSPDFEVYVYKSFGDLSKLKSMEAEQIELIELEKLEQENTISNVIWLTQMALDDNEIYGIINY